MNSALEMIKKNVLSLVCLLIAIIAVVAVFWLQSSKFQGLQSKLDQRKAELTTLEGLAQKLNTRKLPAIDPAETEQKPLGQFPTERVIQAADLATQRVAGESKAVLDEAVKRNEHQPLLPNVLPTPSYSSFINYKDAYNRQVNLASPEVDRTQTLPVRLLHAGLPPTEVEIRAEIDKRKADFTGNALPGGGGGNGQQLIDQQVQALETTVPDEMRKKAANDSMIYINPDALDVYPGLIDNTSAPQQASGYALPVYFSQIGLWVQEDVCKAIADANSEARAKNVTDAPVKHLIKIDVTEEFGHATNGQQGGGGPQADPNAPVSHTPTDRKSNALYEVIPFRLSIIVDATRIPEILKSLSKDRFITVTNMQLTSRDPALAMTNSYYYGHAQIVQLDLECEELFLHSWLQKYMPDVIKNGGAAGGAPPAAQ